MQEKSSTKKQTKPSEGLFSLLLQLFGHISKRRRRQFILLLGLMLISSFAEVVSLGSVVPFIAVLTQPEKIFQYPLVKEIADIFGIGHSGDLILPLTIVFATAALFAGGIRLLLLWVSIRLTNATGADLSIDVYRRTLYQPYPVHIASTSSVIISGITQKVGTATGVLISLVTAVISVSLFMAIMITLLVIDPVVAIVATISFGCLYVVIVLNANGLLRKNSHCIAQEQTQVIKVLQEGLGSIRDVLMEGAQAIYCDSYKTSIQKLQRASGENTYINQAPRFAMETLGMLLIASLAYVLSNQSGGLKTALPILGALALGAQRLLPLMQQIYGNWAVVAGSHAALIAALDLLDQPLPEYISQPKPQPLAFNESIIFDNVSFKYSDNGPWVLEGLNFTIKKNSRIGFVGSTGSGKSTTLDLLMSLLDPTNGAITVDGKNIDDQTKQAWQNNIVHVPQSIYLTDASIAENIAFGVPKDEIDEVSVRAAAAKSQIAEFIENSSNGYNAIVGERGIRLSGGQRQRIGIARALYKQKATVLIFDEATSALDSRTEKAVMKCIDDLKLDLTIIIIAHRLSTLSNCDMIIQLEQGKIVKKCNYEQFTTEEK
jgi:ATP-binding cassette, subfamily B, bacterial PglK